MNIVQYLKDNTIVSIGNLNDEKCVIVEAIPKRPIELVKFIIEKSCYISEIRWWDRVPISIGSKIGYGGVPDPRDPQKYYFAETDIFASFKKTTSISEYIKYLEAVKTQYHNYDLYPAFDIYLK